MLNLLFFLTSFSCFSFCFFFLFQCHSLFFLLSFFLSFFLSFYFVLLLVSYSFFTGPLAKQFECSPMVRETGVQSCQRLKKWYLIPPCLTLRIIRYVSRVKWNNRGKGVAPIEKRTFGSLSAMVTNFSYLFFLLILFFFLLFFESFFLFVFHSFWFSFFIVLFFSVFSSQVFFLFISLLLFRLLIPPFSSSLHLYSHYPYHLYFQNLQLFVLLKALSHNGSVTLTSTHNKWRSLAYRLLHSIFYTLSLYLRLFAKLIYWLIDFNDISTLLVKRLGNCVYCAFTATIIESFLHTGFWHKVFSSAQVHSLFLFDL